MSQTTQQMDFVNLGDDLDFTTFCENLQNPFEEHDIFCVSPNQTVPSVSPDGSPSSYSSDNTDLYYLNDDCLFGGLNDVCPLPMPVIPAEFNIKKEPTLADLHSKSPHKNSTVGKKRTRKSANQPCTKSAKLDVQNGSEFSTVGRTLTIEEEKQLKKQRRLIKNRESAQLSRQRKKQYVSDLENEVQLLRNEKKDLEEKVNYLTSRTIELTNQVDQLTSVLNTVSGKPTNKAAVGLFMIVFLLSLGIFFPQNTTNSPTPYTRPTSVYTGRVLQELSNGEVQHGQDSELSLPNKRTEREFAQQETPMKRIKLELDDGGSSTGEESLSSGPSSYGLMVMDSTKTNGLLEDPIEQEVKPPQFSSDTSYIYCSEAHPLSIAAHPAASNEPPVVTVLLPASALNGTVSEMDYFVDEPENTLLEVTCQILNIAVYPFYNGVEATLPSIELDS